MDSLLRRRGRKLQPPLGPVTLLLPSLCNIAILVAFKDGLPYDLLLVMLVYYCCSYATHPAPDQAFVSVVHLCVGHYMIYGLHICTKVADFEQLCIECTVMRFGVRASNMNIQDGFDSKKQQEETWRQL